MICVTPDGIIILDNELHLPKSPPILVIESGRVMLYREAQSSNTSELRYVTLLGIVIFNIDKHS